MIDFTMGPDDVKAVVRTGTLFDALSRADYAGISLTALARVAGLNEATALRYLKTLVGLRLVERDSDSGSYRLGIRFYQLGERALGAIDPRRIALPFMQELRDRYGETVNLGTLRGSEMVLIEVLEGTHSLKKGAAIGEADVLYATSIGKAVIAHLPRAQVRALLQPTGLRRRTAHTLTSWKALEADLERVRLRGYAIDDEESELGLRCAGTAIFDRRGLPTFALSVCGPASRMTEKVTAEIGSDLVNSAREISRQLGAAGHGFPTPVHRGVELAQAAATSSTESPA